ncbi:MAG: shikimate kinase [Pseudomonadota bacterium]
MDTNGLAPPSQMSAVGGDLRHNIVLVGLPGAGKSSVGRRLAGRLSIPFVDADAEIEIAAGMTIAEIFKTRGEVEFRAGETRVIRRLLEGGPQVIATGGGAFMSPDTRQAIAEHGVSVWLDATTDVLLSRIVKRNHRPLFHDVDPRQKLMELRAVRDPVFAGADIRVTSSAGPHERVVARIVRALNARNEKREGPQTC